ncbi:MAG: phosphotransferase family protein [Propionibacteriaceae bacterium]
MAAEEALTGGNTTVVVRVGDTVRRPVGSWTPAVHDLLDHLQEMGFPGAPRVLGIDERDREVLRYVEGDVGTLSADEPLAPWFRTEEACRGIGRWIRAFQTAQQGFRPDPAKPWRLAPGAELGPGQVIVHHDVSPYNTVRVPSPDRVDDAVVVLDWDFARPGDPIEDLAWAAWMWAPLRAGTWWHAEYGVSAAEATARQGRNLRALLEGYGPEAFPRERLAAAIADQMTKHAADLEDMARTDPAFADLVAQDFATAAREDAAWWADSPLRAYL